MHRITTNTKESALAGAIQAKYASRFAGFALALGIVILFLHPADQYFFNDSLSTLVSRSLTWHTAFLDFFRLGGARWYRPLANGFVQFLVWPLFGMNFAAYHVLAMLLHWVVCLELYLILKVFVEDSFAAWVGAAFYAFHPIQFYATYDTSFYQEPLSGGLVLAALASLYAYVRHGRPRWLAAGSLFFLLALTTREVAVFTPALLAMLVWPPFHFRRATIAVGITGAIGAAFAAVYLWILHPLRYQPQAYLPDWSPAHLAGNLWTCIQWSFAIPAGSQTVGWKSPVIVQGFLWLSLIGAIGGIIVFAKRQAAVWKGPACFCLAVSAALSTHRLWPHHLYLPLMGVALWIAGILACWRQSAGGVRLARPVATALLSCVLVTSAIGARYDSVNSWVGLCSQETRLPALYSRALFRDLPQWRGVWIVATTGDPNWVWLYGRLFNLMAGDAEPRFESRVLAGRPAAAPQGIRVFEYRDSMLWPLAIPASNVASMRAADVRLTPSRVHPGTSYTIAVPALAGRTIDLRYSYNDHLPVVAYEFVQLAADGTAKVFTPRDTAWGVVEVLGVRPSGAAEWSPVSVRVEVLRD
jgi:hypothetical protein